MQKHAAPVPGTACKIRWCGSLDLVVQPVGQLGLVQVQTLGQERDHFVEVELFHALKVRLALLLRVDQTAFDIAALIAHVQCVFPMGIQRHFMTAAGTFHHTFSSPNMAVPGVFRTAPCSISLNMLHDYAPICKHSLRINTTRPPYPAVKGLFGKPTTENNVETFANIPQIILHGAEFFNSMGTEKSSGTKVFALGGKINNTGLVEIPMGTTLREIIEDIGGGIPNGKKFKAAQTGGPSGGCIPASLMDTPIDYDNLTAIGCMMGSGGLIVMDEDNCMVDIAKFFLDFTVDESCGKCTPCRIGTKRMRELLEKITDGKATLEDLDELESLAHYIKDNSLCGLGQTAPNPVLATLRFFKDEYIAHIVDKKCPAGVCKKLVSYSIEADKCKGCTACARKCPVGAISGAVKTAHTIDTSKCVKCGVCMDTCRFGAIIKK